MTTLVVGAIGLLAVALIFVCILAACRESRREDEAQLRRCQEWLDRWVSESSPPPRTEADVKAELDSFDRAIAIARKRDELRRRLGHPRSIEVPR